MPRRTSTDRLVFLRQRQSQIDAQIKALQAREKQTQRKADTRRKVIGGALALEHMQANPGSEFAKVLTRLLDEYVVRPADRALFPQLPPLRPTDRPDGESGEGFTVAARHATGSGESTSS